MVAPFLEAGRDAREPVLVAVSGRVGEVVRSVVPDRADVSFLEGGRAYRRPAGTIRMFLDIFRAHLERAPGRMRVIGEVFDPVEAWEPWARYEAAINDLFARYPASGLCLYDTRTTPADVLGDVRRTHPFLATPDGGLGVNQRFEQPTAFLATRPQPDPDPVENSPPTVELVGASPGVARRAVAGVADGMSLEPGGTDAAALAVSEAVTNAQTHGRPPVTVRAWAAPGRLVVVVRDAGSGPSHPFAGLVPMPRSPSGGRGLWIAHQMCSQVVHTKQVDGFAIRLIMRTPQAAVDVVPGSD